MELWSRWESLINALNVTLPNFLSRKLTAEDYPETMCSFSPLTANERALYDKAGELYLEVHFDPASSESYCVEQLTTWLADQSFSEDDLDTMRAVFSERRERNNEGSAHCGPSCASLCSEGHKYRWILTAIAESKSDISRSDP